MGWKHLSSAMPRKKTWTKKKVPSRELPSAPDGIGFREVPKSTLDLACLTVALKNAGIISAPLSEDENASGAEISDPRLLILKAIQFVDLCAEVQKVLKTDEDWRSQQAVISKRLESLCKGLESSCVSIENVLKAAGLDRLKLTQVELECLHFDKQWDDLTRRDQAVAVFLYLSRPEFQGGISFPNVNTGSFEPATSFFFNMKDETRLKLAGSGIDLLILENGNLFRSLCEAQQIRASKNAADRARKSHEARVANDAHDSSDAKS